MKQKSTKLSTDRMPRESAQEYTAWLLYCELGSLGKALGAWERIFHQSYTNLSPIYREQLGKPVTLRTLKNWSKKHHWVRRKEMKVNEDLAELKKETKRIAKLRIYKITIAFGRALDLKLKQLERGEYVSMSDLKTAWEMHRVEMGLVTGRYTVVAKIDENEQKPLTPEEKELGRRIDKLVIDFYNKKKLRSKTDKSL